MTTEPCEHHPRKESLADCYYCQAPICGGCHNADRRGRAICTPCLDARVPPAIPWEAADSFSDALSAALLTAWRVLRHPRRFWRRHRATSHWIFPSLFAVGTISLGLLFTTLWHRHLSPDYVATLEHFHHSMGISAHTLEFLWISSLPALALLLFTGHALTLLFSLRLFQIDKANWTDVAQITGYSAAAYLWLILPPIGDFSLGHFMLLLWLFNLQVPAIHLRYNTGFWTAILIVFPPLLLLLLLLG